MKKTFIALCAIASLGTGCRESGQVVMQLRVTGTESKSPLRNPGTATRPSSDVEKLQLEAKNAATGETELKEFTNDFSVSNRIEVGALDVTPGTGWTLKLSGIDRYGYLHGLGRSGAFEVPKSGQVEVPVVFGIADDFASSATLGDNGAGPGSKVNVLPNGAALISGPGGFFLHDPRSGDVCASGCLTGEVPPARSHHIAITLQDGRVLIGFGRDGAGATLSDAWLFDGGARSFSAVTLSGAVGRYGSGAALLGDGRVAVIGGRSGNAADASRVQLIDAAAGSVTEGDVLGAPLYLPTAVSLASGAVLVTGGYGAQDKAVQSASLVGVDGRVTALPVMLRARAGHTATVLADNAVLIYGGVDGNGAAQAAPEAFIPEATGGNFFDVQNSGSTAPAARAGHSAARLPTGEVLVMGGEPQSFTVPDPGRQAAALELSVSKVGVSYLMTVTEVGASASRTGGAAALLTDGSILFAGGARAPLLNPEALAPAADWVNDAEVFVPCAVPGEACPR